LGLQIYTMLFNIKINCIKLPFFVSIFNQTFTLFTLKTSAFVNTLLKWYHLNQRDLPWRNTKNPYIIWLSEVILQQTRVAQGTPYFYKFLEKYPTINDFASAPLDEILNLWQGLGYYSRAKNMHACAQMIVEKHHALFPSSYKELIQLKGIGPYTAAAIASFAFKEPVAVVDGNVFRILSRYFGVSEDIASHKGKKTFDRLASELIPLDQPDIFNQAIMEFGSLQCKPKNPDCESCPLQSSCFAFENKMVSQLPFKDKKIKIKNRYFIYSVIYCGHTILFKQRQAGDIWEGLYDFPVKEIKENEISHVEELLDEELIQLRPINYQLPDYEFKHILTHQRLYAKFVAYTFALSQFEQLTKYAQEHNYLIVDKDRINEIGKPRLIVRYLNGEK
jgi:A/G-specific adenine glycosylase